MCQRTIQAPFFYHHCRNKNKKEKIIYSPKRGYFGIINDINNKASLSTINKDFSNSARYQESINNKEQLNYHI